MDRFDVAIIGGGAVGSAVAYVLGAYDLRVAVIEKELDVAMGTSGRNSAVVHAGFNNRPGSLMAQLCVEGNRGFAALCRALDVPYRRTGKLVVGSGAEDARALEGLLRTGLANGCTGLSLLDGAAVSAREPHVRATAAMLSADTAIIDPFLYNIHLAECAVKNGVRYLLGREVTAIERRGGTFRITAGGETVEAGLIVNSAGCTPTASAPWRATRRLRSIPAGGSITCWTRPPGSGSPCRYTRCRARAWAASACT